MPAPESGRARPHPTWQLALLATLGLALFLTFLSLGIWQVQRRAWKLDLIERVTQRIHAEPVSPPGSAQWPSVNAAEFEYQALQIQGQWLPGKTVLTQASTVLGAGYWVLTPLQQADGNVVLVNRGFIPDSQRAQWLAKDTAPSSSVTIVGLLRMTEPGGGFLRRNDPAQQRWHSRDVAAIAQVQQLEHVAPYFVDAGIPRLHGDNSGELLPVRPDTMPIPGLTVVRFSNSHLVYALTWFGLAAMVAAAAVLVARYERRLRKTAANHLHEPDAH